MFAEIVSSLVQVNAENKFYSSISCAERYRLFSQASREPSPDPSAGEGGPEKEASADKNKPEKNAESKQVRE